ncbi:MAG: CRISPR system precrRNA processing endoribonuclease RAMP protein Cas6 [Gammaproteobacteria bacterium]|nr:CRISPR system precrRNA processing endoribonuclease RAMP protein Cas6 [Gammaproteobacteria bacterium]
MSLSSALSEPTLPLAQYRVTLRALERICLPDYSGSAWRGVLGHALKRLACVTKQKNCADCLLYRGCVYSYLFETPPPLNSEKMRNYVAAPHPYLLVPNETKEIQVNEAYCLELTLFGHGNRHLAYLIQTLKMAGERGIGRNNGRFQLCSVEQRVAADEHQCIYTEGQALQPLPLFCAPLPKPPERVTVRLHTPLRLRSEGKNIRPERFEFGHFFSSLLRRLSLLSYFHSDEPLETDFVRLNALAQSVRLLAPELRWQEWRRYSNRQRCFIPMGGIVGSFELHSSELALLWPYLWLGQKTHTGKGSSMGLGRYSLSL